MKVYINGQMMDAEQAFIRVEDAGFQHAVGLFETMGVYNRQSFRLNSHIERLAISAQELGLSRDLDRVFLQDAVKTAVAENKVQQARVRLTVTGGGVSMLKPSKTSRPAQTVVVEVSEPTQYQPEYFDRGVMVLIGQPAANPFDPTSGHKTLAYWSRLMMLRQAASVEAAEVLLLNLSHHLASGTVSNLFLVRDGRLLTPIARGEEVAGSLRAPVLPGITREAIIELAETLGISVERKMLTVEDLLDADEVFLTNSSWQVLPVTAVEKKTIASGNVGEMTKSLRVKLLALIESETATA